jgi:hypothetical protein
MNKNLNLSCSPVLRFVLPLLLVGWSYSVYSQVDYQKGYIMSGDGRQQEAWIKIQTSPLNPEKISYKLSETGEVITGDISTLQGFGIGTEAKYIVREIEIDRSTDDPKDLDINKLPALSKQTVFLRYLLESKLSLLDYQTKTNHRYYWQDDSDSIHLLTYKAYRNASGIMAVNESYKSQLFKLMTCQDMASQIKNLNYRKEQLLGIFKRTNTCAQAPIKLFSKEQNKWPLSIGPLIGLDRFTTDFVNTKTSSMAPRFGIEAELLIPYYGRKWAILLEGSYQSVKTHAAVFPIYTVQNFYSGIEWGLGVRHYFYLQSNSKFLLQANAVIDLPLENKLESTLLGTSQSKFITAGAALSAGYKLKNVTAQLRYYTSRNLNGNQLTPYLKEQGGLYFQKMSLILTYQFSFQKTNPPKPS